MNSYDYISKAKINLADVSIDFGFLSYMGQVIGGHHSLKPDYVVKGVNEKDALLFKKWWLTTAKSLSSCAEVPGLFNSLLKGDIAPASVAGIADQADALLSVVQLLRGGFNFGVDAVADYVSWLVESVKDGLADVGRKDKDRARSYSTDPIDAVRQALYMVSGLVGGMSSGNVKKDQDNLTKVARIIKETFEAYLADLMKGRRPPELLEKILGHKVTPIKDSNGSSSSSGDDEAVVYDYSRLM